MKINDFGEFCKGTPLQFWQVGYVLERLRSVFVIFLGFSFFESNLEHSRSVFAKSGCIFVRFFMIFTDFHGFWTIALHLNTVFV